MIRFWGWVFVIGMMRTHAGSVYQARNPTRSDAGLVHLCAGFSLGSCLEKGTLLWPGCAVVRIRVRLRVRSSKH